MATLRFMVLGALLVWPAVAAAEDPPPPRVFHVPTGWLQPASRAHGTAGLTHEGSPSIAVAFGLGDIAQLEVGVNDVAGDRVGSAAFSLGFGRGLLWRGGPGVTVGWRRSFYAPGDRSLAQLHAASSAQFADLTVHVGADLWIDEDATDNPRPFAGIEYHPPIYPRTTLLADFTWTPHLTPDSTELRWLAGWGIRYQALAWGSVELGVRHREGDAIDDATVFARVNGVLDL